MIGQRLRRRRLLDGHRQVAGHQQQRAERDGLAGAEIAVGQDAADQRQQIDQRGVGAVLARAAALVEQEVLGHVEDQDAAHAVVGEPLPHLGEEEDVQALGVLAQLQEDRNERDQRDHDARRRRRYPTCGKALPGRRPSRGAPCPLNSTQSSQGIAGQARGDARRSGVSTHQKVSPGLEFEPEAETAQGAHGGEVPAIAAGEDAVGAAFLEQPVDHRARGFGRRSPDCGGCGRRRSRSRIRSPREAKAQSGRRQ